VVSYVLTKKPDSEIGTDTQFVDRQRCPDDTAALYKCSYYYYYYFNEAASHVDLLSRCAPQPLQPTSATCFRPTWRPEPAVIWHPGGDAENAGMENGGPWKVRGWKRRDWKRGTKFSRVEKAGPPSTERETDKYRCTAFIETLSNIILYATTM